MAWDIAVAGTVTLDDVVTPEGEGTAQQVHNSMEPTPYSVREVENTPDEMVIHERDDFDKVGDVYRWKKHYRFRTR